MMGRDPVCGVVRCGRLSGVGVDAVWGVIRRGEWYAVVVIVVKMVVIVVVMMVIVAVVVMMMVIVVVMCMKRPGVGSDPVWSVVRWEVFRYGEWSGVGRSAVAVAVVGNGEVSPHLALAKIDYFRRDLSEVMVVVLLMMTVVVVVVTVAVRLWWQ